MEFRKGSPVLHGKMFKTPKSCGSDGKGNCSYVQICNVKDKIIVEEKKKKKYSKPLPNWARTLKSICLQKKHLLRQQESNSSRNEMLLCLHYRFDFFFSPLGRLFLNDGPQMVRKLLPISSLNLFMISLYQFVLVPAPSFCFSGTSILCSYL